MSWPTMLTIIFVTLKMTAVEPVAGWSWFWVLSPSLITWSLIVFIVFVVVIVSEVNK